MPDDRTDTKELVGTERVTGSTPGLLTPEAEAEIERARITNTITAAIAGLSWGENMSSPMRRAYAEYCRRYDVDPVTEMENLGGKVYVKTEWYKRKLGELRIAGIVREVTLEHIHNDPRLDLLRADDRLTEAQRGEVTARWFRSMLKRVEHNVPEDAAAACVCTITLTQGGTLIGCKWAGNGTSTKQPRHNGAANPNPVAEMNPTLYAESTSIRRAAQQLFSHLTGQRISEHAGEYVGLARSLAADAARALPNPEEMLVEGKRLGAGGITLSGTPSPWTGTPIVPGDGTYDASAALAEAERVQQARAAGEPGWETRKTITERQRVALRVASAAAARDPYDESASEPEMIAAAEAADPAV